MQKDREITNELTDESEYIEMFNFCTEHNLFCFGIIIDIERGRLTGKRRKAVLCYDEFESDRE